MTKKANFWPEILVFEEGSKTFATRTSGTYETPVVCKKYLQARLQWAARDEKVPPKMTHIDNGPDPGRNYGETALLMFCRKTVFWPKIRFFCKKNLLKD